MTPIALYTFVVCNRYNIRDQLMNYSSSDKQNDSNSIRSEENETLENESCINESTSSRDESYQRILQRSTETIFTINIPKSDFQAMIIYKKYRKMDRRNRTVRQHTGSATRDVAACIMSEDLGSHQTFMWF